jgi:aspartate kinase
MTFVRVLKFGGTSVGTIDRIQNVAEIIKRESQADSRLAIVVSAMSGETDRLVGLYRSLGLDLQTREYDLLLASGEQASVALLSAALKKIGVRSKPLLGYQAGFLTDTQHSKAKIRSIQVEHIQELWNQGELPVVAGFQGIDETGAITTLGRGGSDTSAVALAAAVGASFCDIYTDVSGVYTADPRICPQARRIPFLSFEECMELASLGAKVLHPRCVEIAAKYRIPVRVINSFKEGENTVIQDLISASDGLEAPVVTALSYDHNMILVTVHKAKDAVSDYARIFGPLSAKGVIIDIISNSAPDAAGFFDLSFSCPKDDLSQVENLMKVLSLTYTVKTGLSKLALVGSGMRTHSGVAARVFKVLAESSIPVLCTSSSEISLTCVVPSEKIEKAIQALHTAFALEKDPNVGIQKR